MTLELQLMVNNETVGAVTVRRLAPLVDPTDVDVECLYVVRRQDDITGTRECQIRHRYGDGTWSLAQAALAAITARATEGAR